MNLKLQLLTLKLHVCKIARRPSVASKVLSTKSEKLDLSKCQFRTRKERTVQAAKDIHCDSHVNTTDEEHKKQLIMAFGLLS